MTRKPSTRGAAQMMFLLGIAAALAGCAGQRVSAPEARPRDWPAVRFAVLSDPHLYDVSISEPGPAFEKNLMTGPKLLAESRQIFEAALAAIAAEKPDFLLICGDLTKDGERASHELAARELDRLLPAGVRVYVVPGNHDVLNPRAFRYTGGSSERVASVTPAEFSSLYTRFGYGAAFQRDPGSLSYVAEAAPGLWVLALDSCRYDASQDGEAISRAPNGTAPSPSAYGLRAERVLAHSRTPYRDNRGAPASGGRLLPATSRWARRVLSDARQREIHVIAMLHHGIMEQFRGEKSWLPEYVIDDYDGVSWLLAGGGVEAAFTGHTHSQDITRRSFPVPGKGSVIYDIETGSTSSWPNPWRMIEIESDGSMRISSRFVTELPDFPHDFPQYGKERVRAWLEAGVESTLRRWGAKESTAAALAAQAARAGLSLYRGDEPGPAGGFDSHGLDLGGDIIAGMGDTTFRDLQIDLPPADNDVTLHLAAGD